MVLTCIIAISIFQFDHRSRDEPTTHKPENLRSAPEPGSNKTWMDYGNHVYFCLVGLGFIFIVVFGNWDAIIIDAYTHFF